MVVWGHSMRLNKNSESLFIPMGGGWLAVQIFFCLSGLLMVNSYFKRDHTESCEKQTYDFIFGKIKSIGLQYYAALLIALSVSICLNRTGLANRLINSIPEFLIPVEAGGVGTIDLNAPTWYISAMLLTMVPLYYLLTLNPRRFIMIISPLTAVLLMGYMYSTEVVFLDRLFHYGIFRGTVIRAACGICAGAVSWMIAEKLKRTELNGFCRRAVGVSEVVLYLVTFAIWFKPGLSARHSYFVLLLLVFAIGLTFSGKGYLRRVFSSPKWKYLNTAALAVYFNHWSALAVVDKYLPGDRFYENFAIMLGITAGLCLIYFALMFLLKYLWNKRLKKLMM